MTNQRAGGTRSKSKSARQSGRWVLDPIFACLIFAGVGLGSLAMGASPRLVILWTTLLGLWLTYREGKSFRFSYRFADIGRGVLIGLAVGLPLVLLALGALTTAIPILFVSVSETTVAGVASTTIFCSLVLLAPLAEELFFRDILQRELGIWISCGLYAAAGLILFLPTVGVGQYPAVLVAVVGAWALLGAMYGLFYERFGFVVTLACHITINMVLLFVPAILDTIDLVI